MLLYISIGLPAEFFELTPLLLFFRLRPSGEIPVASPFIARLSYCRDLFCFCILYTCDVGFVLWTLYRTLGFTTFGFPLRIYFHYFVDLVFLRCSGVGSTYIFEILYRLSLLNCVDWSYIISAWNVDINCVVCFLIVLYYSGRVWPRYRDICILDSYCHPYRGDAAEISSDRDYLGRDNGSL